VALEVVDDIELLEFDETEKNNFQYIVLEISENCPINRDDVIFALRKENVLARRYFWPGCHNMKPYANRRLDSGDRLKNTELVADRVIVMPTGTAVGAEDIRMIGGIIRKLLVSG
jgi:dTDP-4-amino-4,6-dideoxygalactose transaminase